MQQKSTLFATRCFRCCATGVAKGEDDRPVVADRPRKSSGSETTFERDLTSPAEIESGVEAIADDVWAWCDKTKVFARTVTVKVKFADFHQVTRSRSFSGAIVSRDLLRRASVELVRMLLPTDKGVRLLGVTVSNFDNALADANNELPLFGGGGATLPNSLMCARDRVKWRAGGTDAESYSEGTTPIGVWTPSASLTPSSSISATRAPVRARALNSGDHSCRPAGLASRRVELVVSKQRLKSAECLCRPRAMGCEGTTQRMKRDRLAQPRGFRRLLEQPAELARGQMTVRPRNNQRRSGATPASRGVGRASSIAATGRGSRCATHLSPPCAAGRSAATSCHSSRSTIDRNLAHRYR